MAKMNWTRVAKERLLWKHSGVGGRVVSESQRARRARLRKPPLSQSENSRDHVECASLPHDNVRSRRRPVSEWIEAAPGSRLTGQLVWERAIRGKRVVRQPRLRFVTSTTNWRFKISGGGADLRQLADGWWEFEILAVGRRHSVRVKSLQQVPRPQASGSR